MKEYVTIVKSRTAKGAIFSKYKYSYYDKKGESMALPRHILVFEDIAFKKNTVIKKFGQLIKGQTYTIVYDDACYGIGDESKFTFLWGGIVIQIDFKDKQAIFSCLTKKITDQDKLKLFYGKFIYKYKVKKI
jgi:hypothetical protein